MANMGACCKVCPWKKSLLSVKKNALAASSVVNGPHALEIPISGLKYQRLVPMLTSLSGL
jgi:hypothetical protein